jgi:hypothetical protein
MQSKTYWIILEETFAFSCQKGQIWIRIRYSYSDPYPTCYDRIRIHDTVFCIFFFIQ